MKDLDQRLQQVAKKQPRRDLSIDFTARIVAEVKANPTRAPRKEALFMRFIHKPAFVIAALALVLFTGGTTYAATAGFTKSFDLRNIFGYQELTDNNGQKIVRVKTSNCNSTPNPRAEFDVSDRDMYFRLKPNTSIKTEDVTRWVQGYCEEYQHELKNGNIFNQLADYDSRNYVGSKDKEFSSNLMMETGYLGIPDDKNAISLVYQDALSNAQNASFYGILASNATIQDWKGDSFKKSQLKAGRFATVVLRLADPGSQNSDNDKVVHIYMASQDSTFYRKNDGWLGKKFERVQPCSSNNSGYCTATDSTRNQDKNTIERNAGYISSAQVGADYIKKAYDQYFNAMKSGVDYEKAKMLFINTYTTNELSQSLQRPAPLDPIMCVQQNSGSQLAFTTPQVNGSLVTVNVRWSNSGGGDLAEVAYDTGRKKISSIDCLAGM